MKNTTDSETATAPAPRLCDKCAPKKPNEHLERAHFDKWITSPPYEREIRRWPMDETKYAWPGQYRDIAVQIAWEAWQERAAMSSNDQAHLRQPDHDSRKETK